MQTKEQKHKIKIAKSCHVCLAGDLCNEYVYRNDALCENFHIKLEAVERSDNKPMQKSCSTCAEYQKGADSKCFNWPECSLIFDKWKKGKTT